MKCKNCKAVLKKGEKLCPSCGEPVKQRKKLPIWVMAMIITVAVLGTLAGATAIWWNQADVESFKEGWTLVLNLFDAPDNDVYYKDSYSVSAEKAVKWREKKIAAVGGVTLTNGELQAYYWMNVYDFLNNYGYYAVYAGLDYTKPFDSQACPESDGTWQHFFLDDALLNWHKYQSMALLAEEEGIELSEELQNDLDNLRAQMAQSAVNAGFPTIDAMLQADMGPGVTYEDYYSYAETYHKGYQYFEKCYEEAVEQITDEMLETYFAANESTFAESGVTKTSGDVYDVRHVLIVPEGGTEDSDGNMTYSEEEWEACRAKAQALLDEWLEGEATEDTFAQLAVQHSEDSNTASSGGLYESLTSTSNVQEDIQDWYTKKGRQVGEYGLVKSDSGYHILYMSAIEEQWIRASRDALLSDAANSIAAEAMEAYPIRVLYKDIVLGVVDLSQTES